MLQFPCKRNNTPAAAASQERVALYLRSAPRIVLRLTQEHSSFPVPNYLKGGPTLGTLWQDNSEDEVDHAASVILISYRFWMRRFAARYLLAVARLKPEVILKACELANGR
jgi:hypothetical protein